MAPDPPKPSGGADPGKGPEDRPSARRTRRSGSQSDSKPGASLQWAGVGLELAGAVALLTLLGYFVDGWLGTDPWALITGAMIGIVGGLYNLIKRAMRANR